MNINIIRNKSQRFEKCSFVGKNDSKKIINFLICIFFLIGLLIGIIYFKNQINNDFFKENPNVLENINLINKENINSKIMFNEIIVRNITMLLFIWIAGLSLLGAPLLMIYIFYDGFSIGITFSYILSSLGLYEGYIFLFSRMYVTTFINTGIMIILCNSAFKATLNILKQKNSLKIEFVRHSIVCIIMLFLLIISCFIELCINHFFIYQRMIFKKTYHKMENVDLNIGCENNKMKII